MIPNNGPMVPGGFAVPLPLSLGGTGDTGSAWSTFTPTIAPGSGAVAGYTSQTGRYKTIGKTVFVSIQIQASGAGTASGAYSIAGLPLVAAGGGGRTYIMNIRNSSTGLYCSGYIVGGATTIPIFTSAGGNPSFTDQINVEGVYESA